jgi:riboflavin kinase / FMN adenylyltransferase
MEILRSLEEAARQRGPSVVTIGSFDGIHLAHRELLQRIRRIAQQKNAASVAITFEPHPAEILRPEKAPKLLTPLPVKIELFESSGIRRLLILPFTRELSLWTPEKFVGEVLEKALRAIAVVIGDNFRFGHKQAGMPQVMEELGRVHGFSTEILPQMCLRKMTVSSSEIRHLVAKGNVVLANRLLGRPFSVRGPVEKGLGIGSKQTVPTLNLGSYSGILPAAGVYVTFARVATRAGSWSGKGQEAGAHEPSRRLRSVTNIGTRPTFGERALGVETHLLEPREGPSPAEMEVSFLYRLREERKFSSPQELKAQIMKDIRRAEGYFRRLERFRLEVA